MTDQEVAKAYESVCSAGIDRPGTVAAKLKADHLACRKVLSDLLGNHPETIRTRLSGLGDGAHGSITCTAADIRDAMRVLGL